MPIFGDDANIDKHPVFQELGGYSERAAAIVGVALLEDRLNALLVSRFRPDKDVVRKLTRPSGPVGSLGAKADLAYLLGLFSKETLKDIGHAAKIRNKFAHVPEQVTFGTKEIRECCEEITFVERMPADLKPGWPIFQKPYPPLLARAVFMAFCSVLAEGFDHMVGDLEMRALPHGL